MKYSGIVIVLVLFARLIAPAAAQAQDAQSAAPMPFFDRVGGMSLDEAVARALKEESALRAERTAIDVARGHLQQAGLRPNPSLLAEHQTEPSGTDAQTRFEFEWPLDLYRKSGRINVAQRDLEATGFRVQNRERVLASDVRAAYGAVAAAARDVAILDELVAAASRQQQLIAARVDEGATPPIERDMIAVEVQRTRAERVLLAGRAETSLIELKRLLGLPVTAALRIRNTLDELVQGDPQATEPTGTIELRPDVREAAARVSVADARIDQAGREGRLDASIFAMYMRMDAGFAQRGFDANLELQRVRGQFHYLGAGVTLSLPFRGGRQGEVAAARAERVGAEAALDATRLGAQAEVESARIRDGHAIQALSVWSSETRTLARRNLAVASQSYDLGRTTLPELLNESRRYLEFERAFTAALREAYEARQALRRAVGEAQ